MNTEATFYLTCTIFSLVLTLQLTHFWLRRQRDSGVVYWVVSGWLFVATDILYVFRPLMGHELGRVLPTIMVTASYGLLFWASGQVAGWRFSQGLLALIVPLHAAVLLGMDHFGDYGNGRVILDRLLWAVFCLGGAYCLRKGSPYFWRSLNSPATVLALQGIFFCVRALTSVLFVTLHWNGADRALLLLGNLDVMVFNGSFFVSVLIALLHLRSEELASAKVEMETLSELLPVCAWCKKVRDDDGYWSEITEYFARKNTVKMTHGICQSCEDRMSPEGELTAPPRR